MPTENRLPFTGNIAGELPLPRRAQQDVDNITRQGEVTQKDASVEEKKALIRDLDNQGQDEGIGGLSNFGRQFVSGVTDVPNLIPGVNLQPNLGASGSPTTMMGHAGRLAGQTLAVTPAVAAATVGIPAAGPAVAGAGALVKAGKFVKNVLHGTGQAFKHKPIRTTALETAAGATAGVGGYGATQVVDHGAAKFLGEIIGGFFPYTLPSLIASRGLKNVWHRVGQKRAEERILEAIPEQADRVQAIKNLEDPTIKILDESGKQPEIKNILTPAQRTGNPGIQSLELDIIRKSEELKRTSDSQIAKANAALKAEIEAIATGGTGDEVSLEPLTNTLEEAKEYYNSAINLRIELAARSFAEKVEDLGSVRKAEELDAIAREELEEAYQAAKESLNAYYDSVPKDTLVPMTAVMARFQELKANTGSKTWRNADKSIVMPDKVKVELDPERRASGAPILGKVTYGTKEYTDTMLNIRDFQSDLRREARDNPPNEKFKRNLFALADAIDDDLANNYGGPQIDEALKIAHDFNREIKDKFTRGEVGSLLGFTPRGTRAVTDSGPLGKFFRTREDKRLASYSAIINAMKLANEDTSTILNAVEDYTRIDFLRRAVNRDNPSPDMILKYIRKNEELLAEMPELKQQMENLVVDASGLKELKQKSAKLVDFGGKDTAQAAVMLNKSPKVALENISKLPKKQAMKQLNGIISRLEKDETGDAMKGLKYSFLKFLLDKGKTGDVDAYQQPTLSGFGITQTIGGTSTPVLSGKAISDVFHEHSTVGAMAFRILEPGERKRFALILNEMKKLETRLNAEKSIGGVSSAEPSRKMNVLAGLSGAAMGRVWAERLGVNATVAIPSIFAKYNRDLLRGWVRNPALMILGNAVTDEKLMKDLLTNVTPDGQIPRKVEKRLRSFLIGMIVSEGGMPTTEGEVNEESIKMKKKLIKDLEARSNVSSNSITDIHQQQLQNQVRPSVVNRTYDRTREVEGLPSGR